MAISTWKAALDDIAAAIRTERQAYLNSVQRITDASANLSAIQTDHADAITEITGLGSGTAEETAKQEYDLLRIEFLALRSTVNTAITALSGIEV